ncbi:MAG: DUF503 domain-containing protein [Peptococcaceae bacterium]|nr:DUF503 domain-containing protein [Peptococcaceae bacterium]
MTKEVAGKVTVGVLTIELFFDQSGSLKDKRQLLKGVIERLRSRFNVSVAEVDGMNLWQRSTVAVALVGNQPGHVTEVLEKILRFVEEQDLGQVAASHLALN